ncbi:protein rogdi homolog isoform X1 [Oscarella lobularis]|uniref:protein rogdi homolog isoform X1 n=1 Tax=Oscarella lobularis TaxID=121494 RepID=UPI0033132D1A
MEADEVDWLFSEYVPPVLQQLEDSLKDCVTIFDRAVSYKRSGELKPFVLKSKDVEGLTGVIVLHGDKITKATIKLSRARSGRQETKHELSSKTPWHLSQILDASSNVKAALGILETRRKHLQTINDVIQLVELLAGYLCQAHKCMTVPSAKLKSIYHMKSEINFRPPLPNDVLVNFFISANKLVMSFYMLQASSSSSGKSSDGKTKTIEIRSQLMEVLHHYEVDSLVPWLDEVLDIVPMTLASCQQLLQKISLTS